MRPKRRPGGPRFGAASAPRKGRSALCRTALERCCAALRPREARPSCALLAASPANCLPVEGAVFTIFHAMQARFRSSQARRQRTMPTQQPSAFWQALRDNSAADDEDVSGVVSLRQCSLRSGCRPRPCALLRLQPLSQARCVEPSRRGGLLPPAHAARRAVGVPMAHPHRDRLLLPHVRHLAVSPAANGTAFVDGEYSLPRRRRPLLDSDPVFPRQSPRLRDRTASWRTGLCRMRCTRESCR